MIPNYTLIRYTLAMHYQHNNSVHHWNWLYNAPLPLENVTLISTVCTLGVLHKSTAILKQKTVANYESEITVPSTCH